MAVYERAYRRYTGELTPERTRFLVISRFAFREVFQTKVFLAFFVLCFVPLLVTGIVIYLHHNLSALTKLEIPLKDLIPIDARFFSEYVVGIQSILAFFLALFVGPGLVSADLRNNALPLYLSRPFSRDEYVLGKLSVLLILLSAITWVPAMLLYFFQAYLEGMGWLADNARIGWAVFLSCWAWILSISLLTLAVSAWVKWKPLARLALLALLFVLQGWAEMINAALDVRWGGMISLLELNETVRDGLFGRDVVIRLPVWAAGLGLVAVALGSLALLSRRVRAFEVVR